MGRYKNSLVFKITIGTASVMAILFSVLIISNLYSLYIVKSNMINSTTNELKIHIRDMDNSLNNGVKDLNEISLNLDDINRLKSDNESIRYFASIKLYDILSNKVSDINSADAYIIYDSVHDTYLSAFSARVIGANKILMKDYIKSESSKLKYDLNSLWIPLKINNGVYMLKMYRFSSTFVGAFIKTDSLMDYIESLSGLKGQFIMTDNNGNKLAVKGEDVLSDIHYPLPNNKAIVSKLDNKYIMITANLRNGYARLSYIVKEKNVIFGLNIIQWLIVFLGILSLFIMPYIVYFLNKEIIRPINGLMEGIRQVEGGNLDYHVETKGHAREFKILSRSFNDMTKEIKSLKIEAYEEQLELQKSELKYLQMQIRPHFFLNAITTIHSLSFKNKNKEIREFIDALSKYLRYMFKGGLTRVPIKEEIEQVSNYICMQEIKFPNSVFHVFDINPDIENEPIPQFLILTFIENSFKHAMTLEETLSVFIKAEPEYTDEGKMLKILIEDSGEGFPEEVIDEINNSDNNEIKDGYKVGISNIKRTLSLLYGKNNLLSISNVEPAGARVKLLIPIEKGD